MSKITEKNEKMCKTIKDFLERNSDYAIEINLISTDTDFIIGRFIVPIGRNCDKNGEGGYTLSCNNSSIKIPYEEVIACYEEKDEYGSQTVHVIMKCGIMIDFECVGMRL